MAPGYIAREYVIDIDDDDMGNLNKLSVLCADCGRETVYDLDKEESSPGVQCENCKARILLCFDVDGEHRAMGLLQFIREIRLLPSAHKYKFWVLLNH